MKVFFKLIGDEFPVFSVEFPERIFVCMLPPALEVYFRFSAYALQEMQLVSSDMTGHAFTGCSMIQMRFAVQPDEQQAFVEATLLKFARFCELYTLKTSHVGVFLSDLNRMCPLISLKLT